jgi:hypothetical protein
MARALPVTQEEVDAEGLDYYPMINCERKPEDHGRVDGRLVVLDYGLPDADVVREQRATYQSRDGPAIQF